jgi:hypothetical protein
VICGHPAIGDRWTSGSGKRFVRNGTESRSSRITNPFL